MLIVSDVYTDLANRLNDLLNISGGNVSNLAKDLLNRGQQSLWLAYDWEALVKFATLTVSATTKIATLPADFGRLVEVYSDTDGDGKPDVWYYRNGQATNGFSINPAFVKATGHSYVMTFFAAPQSTVKMKYVMVLPAFEATGTEYSFFPGDLLLLESQIIHFTESGEENNQLQALKDRRDGVLNRTVGLIDQVKAAMNFRGNDTGRYMKDALGGTLTGEDYSLDGGTLMNSRIGDLPSTDRK